MEQWPEGEVLWKSCERGEGGWEGSLGGGRSVPVQRHLVGVQMCCHFTQEPLKGDFYSSGSSSPAIFMNKCLCTSLCFSVGSVALGGKS